MRLGRGFGFVQPFEQVGGGFDEIAGRAERGVARDRAEADQPFAAASVDRVEPERLGRGIMAAKLAGRFDAAAMLHLAGRDRSGPGRSKRGGPPVSATMVDSRPCAVGAAVDDQRDAAAEAGEDMLGAGRADPAAGIGGRGGERAADGVEQVAHRRMGGRADRDRRQAGGDQGGDRRARAQAAGRGSAGPANKRSARRLRLVAELGDFSGLGDVADMDDQRIEGAAAPWPRRCARPPRHWRRRRRGRRRSRSASRRSRRRRSAAPPRRSPRAHRAGRGCFARSPRRAIAALSAAQPSGASDDLHAARRRTEVPARPCRAASPICSTIATWSRRSSRAPAQFAAGEFAPLEPDRRRGRRQMVARGRDACRAGFRAGLSRLCRGRLGHARRARRAWRPGPAADPRHRADGGSGLGQHGLLAGDDADAGRGRGAAAITARRSCSRPGCRSSSPANGPAR